MRTYLAAFVLALVLCAALTPLVRYWAIRLGAVSVPGGRNHNTNVVPRLGGIAIAIAALMPLLTLFIVDSGVASFIRQRASLAAGLLLGGGLLCCVGVIDDTRGLRARYKLAAQVLVAVLAHQLGFRIDAIHIPFLGVLPMGIFSLPVTVLWIVGVTNAVNLIDGLDGLAAGVVFCAAVTNLVVALATGGELGPIFVGLLMASLMGALVGFLFYNFNPARIYMGDSGSYFLGFVLATSSIMAPLQKHSTAISLLVPMVALGVPIFDTLFSMVRRYLERRPILSPDRGHLHHRLLDMGITHRGAVFSLYGISLLFSGAAIAVALGRDWEVGLALVGASAVLFALVRAVGYLDYARLAPGSRSQVYDRRVERLRQFTPDALQRLAASHTLEELRAVLGSLVDSAELARARIVDLENQVVTEANSDSPPQAHILTRLAQAKRSYPVAGLPYHMHLEFPDDQRPSPQADILLQLFADGVQHPLKALMNAPGQTKSFPNSAAGAS